jgi:hypothetical protein
MLSSFFSILRVGGQKASKQNQRTKPKYKAENKERPRPLEARPFALSSLEVRLGADPAGSENPVRDTPHGMTMRHWITSFS